jgi:hypothetical protein
VNSHPNLTVDVGQVLFGETTTMTADGPLGYYLSKAFHSKWFSADTEMESGCGIAPIEYKNTSLVHSLQWAIGLEWYLLATDPWRVVMSTDHPQRRFVPRLSADHPAADGSHLSRGHAQAGAPGGARTIGAGRADPRVQPLRDLHHHAQRAGEDSGTEEQGPSRPGADADITIYTPNDDKTKMFELPRAVIKSGVVIVDQGENSASPLTGKLLYVAPEYDTSIESDIAEWFEKYYSGPFPQLRRPSRLSARRRGSSVLTLRYKSQTPIPVEVEGLTPSAVRAMPLADIERFEIFHGIARPARGVLRAERRCIRWRLQFEGDLSGVHWIGAKMSEGEIHVRGDAGRHVGSEMSGGVHSRARQRERLGRR